MLRADAGPMSNPFLFFRRDWRERALFCEALAELVRAKVLVHTVPFRWIAPGFGRQKNETAPTIPSADRKIAVDVSWAVQAAARHVRLGFVCLPQAMAAQRMLRRRGLASTLYLGVALEAEKASLQAHAWLRAGDKVLTGEAEARRHTQLIAFGDEPAR
ncbi:MAG: hypothetical protein RLZZ15_3927 [Verrucomicrobiota bacterium]|jgi:hypothetical protein